jgi:two-component system chemotaxis sensor kinase CheA
VSTRDVPTAISGRGVGLDVVAREVASVGGHVELEAEPGLGFRLTLTMPALLRADLIVPIEYERHRLALPARNVETFTRIDVLERTAEGTFAVVEHEGTSERLPVFTMDGLFRAPKLPSESSRAVLVHHHDLRFLLVVDSYGSPRPLPFQPIGELALRSPLVQAISPSPEGVHILFDVAELARTLREERWPDAQAEGRRRKRVVVVEDAPVARELLCTTLRSSGLEVFETSHGGEGLRAIREHAPDLVLTDLEMPFVGGLELIRALREDPRFVALPIIVLTSDAGESARHAAQGLNVAGFLLKQKFEESELRSLVQQSLGGLP